VLIVDWDIHHGNGTQHLFESDPRYGFKLIKRTGDLHIIPKRMLLDSILMQMLQSDWLSYSYSISH